MNRVEQIIARYASAEGIRLGVAPEFPSAQLREDLKETLQQNRLYFNILFGGLIGIMIVIVVLLALFIREPQVAAGILAVSGVSLPYLIRMLLHMWQMKIQAETLIVLSTHLEPTMMRSIVKVLSQGLALKPLPQKK
jgi:hypothetical protein